MRSPSGMRWRSSGLSQRATSKPGRFIGPFDGGYALGRPRPVRSSNRMGRPQFPSSGKAFDSGTSNRRLVTGVAMVHGGRWSPYRSCSCVSCVSSWYWVNAAETHETFHRESGMRYHLPTTSCCGPCEKLDTICCGLCRLHARQRARVRYHSSDTVDFHRAPSAGAPRRVFAPDTRVAPLVWTGRPVTIAP